MTECHDDMVDRASHKLTLPGVYPTPSLTTLKALKHADDALLATLGYRSEFRREFSLIETIAFAFSIMGVVASVSSTMYLPLISSTSRNIFSVYPGLVTDSLAELTSAMPTSAGLYYFSAKLAPPRWAPLASWITGWANITGQVSLVCSIDFTCAQMITTALFVGSDGAIDLGAGPTFGILLVILFTHGLVYSAATAVIARLNIFYVIVNVGTTIAAIVALLVCSGDRRVSTSTAFTMYGDHTGWSDNDSAAHISEETSGAARAAPIAILVGVGATASLGWLLYIAASFAAASIPDLLASPLPLPMGQLFLDVLGKRSMLAIWSHIIVVQYVTGAAQGVDASRVVFAFARDIALPGSRWWKKMHPYSRMPVNAFWLVMVLSAICGLLGFSETALSSLAGAAVIGLYTSYLGRWYMPIGIVAVAWVSVLLMFPPEVHPTPETMNYAVVLIMAVFVFASLPWIFSARKWFKGPVRTVEQGPRAASEGASDEKPETKEASRVDEGEPR
ncbi:amino acid transporter [Fomes fomentarius]|nr:amino acid transporter [Fomes fomentarius]